MPQHVLCSGASRVHQTSGGSADRRARAAAHNDAATIFATSTYRQLYPNCEGRWGKPGGSAMQEIGGGCPLTECGRLVRTEGQLLLLLRCGGEGLPWCLYPTLPSLAPRFNPSTHAPPPTPRPPRPPTHLVVVPHIQLHHCPINNLSSREACKHVSDGWWRLGMLGGRPSVAARRRHSQAPHGALERIIPPTLRSCGMQTITCVDSASTTPLRRSLM